MRPKLKKPSRMFSILTFLFAVLLGVSIYMALVPVGRPTPAFASSLDDDQINTEAATVTKVSLFTRIMNKIKEWGTAIYYNLHIDQLVERFTGAAGGGEKIRY